MYSQFGFVPWSRNRFAAFHAREVRQSHRQGNEFQNKFQIKNKKDVTSIVKNELAIFEVEGKRGANLESF
jgi:hypothetical protein